MISNWHLYVLALVVSVNVLFYQVWIQIANSAEHYQLDAMSYLMQLCLASMIPTLTKDPESITGLRTMASSGSHFIVRSNTMDVYDVYANYSIDGKNLNYKQASVEPTERLPIRIINPKIRDGKRPVILYMHGGGWTVGSMEDDPLIQSIAEVTNYIVVSLDYRLAPEYIFPHAVYDCVVALHWVRANIAAHGGDVKRIFLMGESAGGNLAAALISKEIADASIFRPIQPIAGIVMVYPPLDPPNVYRDSTTHALHVKLNNTAASGVLSVQLMDTFRELYLGEEHKWDPQAGKSYLFSPSLAPKSILKKYPPTMLILGTCDILTDEGLAFAKQLNDTKRTQVEVLMFIGGHGFFGRSPEGVQTIDNHITTDTHNSHSRPTLFSHTYSLNLA